MVIKNPLAGASSYTLEYWVRTTQTNGGSGQWYNGNGIVDGDIGGADYDLGTSLLGTKLAFGTGNPSSVGDATIVSHSNVNTGKWVFVAATRNANTGLMKLYINGVAEDSTVAGITPLATNSTMTMGGANTGGSKFQGSIDEVRMFNTDRSANILADMADTLGRTAPGLAAYYNFDEGVAAGTNTGINLLFDQGANNITGTLYNFALTGSTSNWVESYAAVVPTVHPASGIYSTGFTASWATPYLGIADNYLLDVATDTAFTNIVAGYSALPVNGTYKTVKGLTLGNKYYYRVSAEKASVTGQGAYSGIVIVKTAPAAPVINSFTPTFATTAGAAITITGTSFAGATAVSFGGNPATSFTVVSDSLVTAVIGAGATGSVSITTPLGTATKAGFVFGQPTSSTTLVTICASALPYKWNGTDYTAPGSYTIHLANVAASDSSATLVLTVNQPTTSTTRVAVCASSLPYNWNGTAYNAAGTYTYITANSAGCDSVATLVMSVSQPTTSKTPVAVCASALPYNWNGNSYNAAGTYTVHLTNAAGCDSAATLVLTVSPVLSFITHPVAASSCGSDGRISVGTTGGTWPMMFTLTKPDGATVTQRNNWVFNNLAAGTYSISATDTVGCIATATGVLVTQTAPLTLKTYPDAASSCGSGSDGRISMGTTGGKLPVVFTLIKPDGTTVTQKNNWVFNNLAAGTYSIIATDTSGCTATATGVVVTQPAPLTFKTYPVAASSCGGGSDGRISVGTTGGKWPVVFTLTKPDGTTVIQKNNWVFNNLAAGTYSISATDTSGCTATATGVVVAQIAPLTFKTYPDAATSCGSGSDGRISVGTTGGKWPVVFTLTKPDGTTITQKNNWVFNNLAAGTYSISATDTSGCTATATGVVVAQIAPLTFKTYPDAASSCGSGSDGKISVGTTGGKWPVVFTLTKPDGTTVIQKNNWVFNNLAAGTYSIIATDTAGCTATATGVVVTQTVPLTFKTYPVAASSCSSDGRISVGTTGGKWPVVFTLTKPDGTTITQKNNWVFNNLAAGTYSISATDTSGCTATATGVVVTQTAPLTLKTYPDAASSCGSGSDGRISMGTTGGKWPVVFTLTKPDGTTVTQKSSLVFNNLAAGIYSIIATDTSGCTATATGVVVTQPAPLTFKTYPVAASSCSSDGRISVGTTGGKWPVVFTLTKPDGTTVIQKNNWVFNNLAAGTYSISATDTSGCTATATGVVVNNAGGPCSSIATPASKVANPKFASAKGETLKINVLPNPTVTNFTLTLRGGDDKKVAELIVMDMAGRIVYHTVGSVFDSYTFGQTFANGMYIAEVLNGNKVVRVKLVKGH